MTEQLSFLSPQHRRRVAYLCPSCKGQHSTSVPAAWTGKKILWLYTDCESVHSHIRVVVDCSAEAVT